MTLHMVTKTPTEDKLATEAVPKAGEAYAWDRFTEQLVASADVAAICRILNGVERRARGLPPCELKDLDLKDALRLLGMARGVIWSLDPEVCEQALEEMAIVLCEGAEAEYAKFTDQSVPMQNHYRLLAQTALNAYRWALEGRR